MLARVPRVANENVLVGYDAADDAGVYRLTPECALVQTVDFFTPIVDDPYTFGAIAAANSLSDVYAMGGTPVSALSIVAYPAKGDLDDLAAILKGGADKLHEAGCVVLGGHSVGDDEIKFGYAVTGVVHPERFTANSGARAGDAPANRANATARRIAIFIPGQAFMDKTPAVWFSAKHSTIISQSGHSQQSRGWTAQRAAYKIPA